MEFLQQPVVSVGLIFSDLLIHGSRLNMSLWNRSIFSLILNSTSNAYTFEERPDFKHHRNLTQIKVKQEFRY